MAARIPTPEEREATIRARVEQMATGRQRRAYTARGQERGIVFLILLAVVDVLLFLYFFGVPWFPDAVPHIGNPGIVAEGIKQAITAAFNAR
jgi:hypothetical protein